MDNDLINALKDNINKQFKNQKVAYFLGGEESPSDYTDFVSTGCDVLDLIIANRPNAGLPAGRIVEMSGLEGSSKSLLVGHVLANTQKKGGIAILFDTENALDKKFATAIGIDLSKLLYIQLDTLEKIFETIENILDKIILSDKDNKRFVTIAIDSVSSAMAENEVKSNYEKEGWNTDKAIILSKAMRKLTQRLGNQRVLLLLTSQLRDKLGASFGDTYTTSGGHAIPFHSSVRLRLKKMAAIKATINGIETEIGVKVVAQVVKNRIGPPKRKTEFRVYYDRGIDNYSSWLEVMKAYNLVKQGGAWYTLTNRTTGEDIKFQEKTFIEKIINNSELKTQLYQDMCDSLIMNYRSDDIDESDIIIDESEKNPDIDETDTKSNVNKPDLKLSNEELEENFENEE